MNIVFEKIRWRNFLSTGNAWTEIDITSSKMSLVVGINGAGKSTMLDVLTFVLFNKPFRKVNKPQLVNSITRKDCLGEVEFRIGSTKYKIVRGIKPAVFEIWKNDELINQDAKNVDYQAHLEKHILKTNYKTFCQIVILGSASFVPFMQLPSGQRREITEDVLDLQIFTSMNTLIKDKISAVDRAIIKVESDKEIASTKLKMSKVHAHQLVEEKQKQIHEKEERIDELTALIQSARIEIVDKQKEVALISLNLSGSDAVSRKHKKLGVLRSQLLGRVAALSADIDFLYKHDNCPTCHQVIDSKFKKHTECSKADTIKEVNDGLAELEKQYTELEEKLSDFAVTNQQISAINVDIHVLNTKVDGAVSQIKTLERELNILSKEKEEIVDESDVLKLETELNELVREKEELTNDQYMMNYVSVLLKDTGIKARIIKQYVPIINKLINKYLAALEFFVDFNLDENFEETIKSRGRDDFSYNSFSEGEKMRIDLAVLFAWRAVSKMRSSINTNLLIMDEVFDGSLDSAGTEEFMKILGRVTEDNNVFIISHKTDQLWDKFEKVIKFEKNKNFSRLAA